MAKDQVIARLQELEAEDKINATMSSQQIGPQVLDIAPQGAGMGKINVGSDQDNGRHPFARKWLALSEDLQQSEREKEIGTLVERWMADPAFPCGKPTEDTRLAAGRVPARLPINHWQALSQCGMPSLIRRTMSVAAETTTRELTPALMILIHDIE